MSYIFYRLVPNLSKLASSIKLNLSMKEVSQVAQSDHGPMHCPFFGILIRYELLFVLDNHSMHSFSGFERNISSPQSRPSDPHSRGDMPSSQDTHVDKPRLIYSDTPRAPILP